MTGKTYHINNFVKQW